MIYKAGFRNKESTIRTAEFFQPSQLRCRLSPLHFRNEAISDLEWAYQKSLTFGDQMFTYRG